MNFFTHLIKTFSDKVRIVSGFELINASDQDIKKCVIFAFLFKLTLMNIKFSAVIYTFSVLLLASCAKDEGEGGTSTIKGKLFEKVYDNGYTRLLSHAPSPDENVYIIYGGDDETYDDD